MDPPSFCRTLAELCKPGGLVAMSTTPDGLSYSPRSWRREDTRHWHREEANDPSFHLSIRRQDAATTHPLLCLSRHMLAGAHDWNQFTTPDEPTIMCEDAGLGLTAVSGCAGACPRTVRAVRDTSVNIAAFPKFVTAGRGTPSSGEEESPAPQVR